MISKPIFFLSNRGWKITEPLKSAGWSSPEVILCTGGLASRIRASIQLLVTLYQNPDADIFTDTPMWIGLVVWTAALVMKRRYIIRLRGDTYREHQIRGMPFHRFFFVKRLLRDSAGIIPVSAYLLTQLSRQVPGITANKIKVIPTPQIVGGQGVPFERRESVLLIVTTFRLKDKVDILFRMLPDFDALLETDKALSIRIVGDGPLLKSFRENVLRLKNRKRILLSGFVSDVKTLYLNDRALLHVSDLDAYPSVVNEARAFGLPVIVSDTVGMPEQVEDGFDGLIIDEQPGSLEQAWRQVTDKKNWDRLSDRGGKRVASENNPERIGKMFTDMINEVFSCDAKE